MGDGTKAPAEQPAPGGWARARASGRYKTRGAWFFDPERALHHDFTLNLWQLMSTRDRCTQAEMALAGRVLAAHHAVILHRAGFPEGSNKLFWMASLRERAISPQPPPEATP